MAAPIRAMEAQLQIQVMAEILMETISFCSTIRRNT
jgi:hypothetical protein